MEPYSENYRTGDESPHSDISKLASFLEPRLVWSGCWSIILLRRGPISPPSVPPQHPPGYRAPPVTYILFGRLAVRCGQGHHRLAFSLTDVSLAGL